MRRKGLPNILQQLNCRMGRDLREHQLQQSSRQTSQLQATDPTKQGSREIQQIQVSGHMCACVLISSIRMFRPKFQATSQLVRQGPLQHLNAFHSHGEQQLAISLSLCKNRSHQLKTSIDQAAIRRRIGAMKHCFSTCGICLQSNDRPIAPAVIQPKLP